jgi:hypothetical protein
MWCVSALAMCCASSEIKRCVIVHWVFIFIVFVGEGSMSLVPAQLQHLGVLSLEQCICVRAEYIDMIMAAVPELVVVNSYGKVVGGMRNEQLRDRNGYITRDGYDILRQWALAK